MIGCLLDLDAGQLAFSLNGDLLQDPLGSSVAFEGVSRVPLVPAITLAAGEKAQLNFGRSEVNATYLFHLYLEFYIFSVICRKLYVVTILCWVTERCAGEL